MKFITVTQLKLKATQVVKEIESSKEEVIITKNGLPVVMMRLISADDFILKQKDKGKEVIKHGRQKRTI